jgi:GDPmannose 4,6-dehydratase
VTVPRRARALITGAAGQDGSYLAELLCAEGLDVHGVVRDAAAAGGANLAAVRDSLTLHVADLLEPGALAAVVEATEPDQIYHLAAPAFVPDSWSALALTVRAIAGGTAELIDAVRAHAPAARAVVAGSREMFGSGAPSPQSERTPCRPSTPYGVAKLAAHQLVGLARARCGLHLSSAILFNHESPRRRPEFVTSRVARGVAAIRLGRERRLTLGDLDAVRDWCAAVDVARGMTLMAAAPQPDDYVLASGVGHTVRELVAVACAHVGLDPEGLVDVDPSLVREREASPAIGDAALARERLSWTPQVSFEELVGEMVDAELAVLSATRS